MTVDAHLENTVRYLSQAQELRAMAQNTAAGNSRDLLLNAAKGYEQMAYWVPPLIRPRATK